MRSQLPAVLLLGLLFSGAVAAAESAAPTGSAAPAPSPTVPTAPGSTSAPAVSGTASPSSTPPSAAATEPSPPPEATDPDTAPAAAPTESRYDALPPNPEVRDVELAPPPPKRRPLARRLELSGAVGVATRGSSTAEIDISPGPVGSVHGRVAFLEWLGVAIRAGVEFHDVAVANQALGFDGLEAEQDAMQIVFLSAEIDPRLRLSSQWYLHAGVGLSWNRVGVGEMKANEPVEFGLDPRTGVLLDVTLSPRLSYHFSDRWGLSLRTRAALPLLQSGDVFASGPSELQTVRTDNGQLLSVGGFPDLTQGLSAQLSVDVSF